MIKIIFFTLALYCSLITPVLSQTPYPDLSYDAIIIERAGFTNFKITYGRPLQRGRSIFGAFIPYDKRWRAGANGTTRISFDTPVYAENKKIEPGTYTLLTVPRADEWEIILHKDTTMFTQRRDYLTSDEVAHIKVKSDGTTHHQEAFTIFTDIVNNNLVINLVWDLTRVSFILNTGTTNAALNSLRSKIVNGQLKTAEEFANGANFLAFSYSNLGHEAKDTALLLINKAIELEPQSWHYQIKRNIFLFSRDFNGIEKTTNGWISFYEKRKSEGYEEDIHLLRDELTSFKQILLFNKQ